MRNELCRPYNLEKIKPGEEIEIQAGDVERAELAKRFSVPEIVNLEAYCSVRKMKNREIGDYRLNVKMSAEITQQCVMTLDEVTETIVEEFSVIFKEDKRDEKEDRDKEDKDNLDLEFDMDEEDIEFISSSEIDLGKYIAEYLSLSINPYPKQKAIDPDKLGYEVFDENQITTEPKKENPFNVLKDLKHKT